MRDHVVEVQRHKGSRVENSEADSEDDFISPAQLRSKEITGLHHSSQCAPKGDCHGNSTSAAAGQRTF
jgi:hypothetical protein